MLKSDITDPEQEIDRLLKQLHASVPSQFRPALDCLKHEITRLSTGINVLNTWPPESAILEPLWRSYGLTPFEARTMAAMHASGPAGISKDRLMAVVYSQQINDWPELKILDVRIHHIRAKLLAVQAPWWIETINCTGWVLHEGQHTPRKAVDGANIWSRDTNPASRHSRGPRSRGAKPNPA